jgi:hypothetical protein
VKFPTPGWGLPAVGVLNAKVKDLMVKQVQALDGETNRTLGVEKWKGAR